MYRDESRESLQSSDRSQMRERIIDHFINQDSTADEVAAAFDFDTHNYTSPIITQLRKSGILLPTGERRKTRSGCFAAVLTLNNEMQVGDHVFRFGWEKKQIVVDVRHKEKTKWCRAQKKLCTLSEAKAWVIACAKIYKIRSEGSLERRA